MAVRERLNTTEHANARTRARKAAFLAAFRETGNVRTAAAAAGIGRTVVYLWQEHDQDFVLAFRQAELDATERLEAEALTRALGYDVHKETMEILRDRSGRAVLDDHGEPKFVVTKREISREYNATILLNLLKARAPEKYRERHDVQMHGLPAIKEVAGVALEAVT